MSSWNHRLDSKTECSELTGSLDEITNFVFRSFYYKWSLSVMKDESEEAAKQTIYKDNSEDEVEEDFKRMFPDYEDVISLEEATKIKMKMFILIS